MRLFTAVDPSPDVHQNLERLLGRLRSSADIRWTGPDNLHLTLKFIGEWPESQLPDLESALQSLPERQPFSVELRGLGFFPNARSPRVFWVGVERSAELGRLAIEVDEALGRLGIPREQRAYSPHLTLARIPDGARVGGLHRAIAGLSSVELGAFLPDRFYLYRSRPGPGGSVYTRIGEFAFQR